MFPDADGREARTNVRVFELLKSTETGLEPGEVEGQLDRIRLNPEVDKTIDEALDAYANSIWGWEGKRAQLIAEAAKVPWVMSPEEYMEEKAFEAAEQVIAERHLPDDPATRSDAAAYRETMRWFRVALDVMKGDPASQASVSEGRKPEATRATEPGAESDTDHGVELE